MKLTAKSDVFTSLKSINLIVFKAFAIACLSLAIPQINLVGQSTTNEFGTGTGSHTTGFSTTFLPNPSSGTSYVRIGSTGGSVNLQTPGVPGLGCLTEVRAVAPTTASVVKFTPFLNYTTASSSGYLKFNMLLGSSTGTNSVTSGTWSMFLGNGAMYNDANAFVGSQIFSGFQFVFGASGAVTTNYRNGSGWTPISPGISQGNIYTIELVMNNSAALINYTYGSAQSVAAYRFDLWVNGTLVGNDLNKAQLANGTALDDLCFYGESSASNAANIFVDDVEMVGPIPATITRSSVAIANTAVTASTVPQSTSNVILQQFNITPSNLSAVLNAMSVTTQGTYIAADVSNLKLWFSPDAAFSAGTDVLLSTLSSPGVAGSKTFPAFACQTFSTGTTGYLFVTVDATAVATTNNTISLGTTSFNNISFASASKTGTDPVVVGGVKTFGNPCTDVGIASVSATDQTICSGSTANLTAQSVVGTNVTVTWWSATGGTGTNLGTGTTLNSVGVGTYYARVTGDCGSPVEVSIVISQAAAPTTSALSGNASPTCNATGAVYSVTLTTGSTYAWNVPAGSNITSGGAGPNNNSITVDIGTTNGSISVTETNSESCIGTAVSIAITIAGCGLDANFSASATSVCSAGSLLFTNTSSGTTGSTSYSWNFGTGASPVTATGVGPHTVTYTGSGNSSVSLQIVDGATNTENKVDYITRLATPTVTVGAVVAAICQGGTSAALNGSFGGSASSAIWSDGGAGGSFANNTGTTPATATYTAASNAISPVTLTLITSGGSCGGVSGYKLITVNPTPTANAGSALAAICRLGSTAALGGSFGGGATQAVWNDGGAGGSFTNNSGTTPNTTVYTASLTSGSPVVLTLLTSGGSCGTTSVSKNVVVNILPAVSVGSALSAICSGVATPALGGTFSGSATGAVWSDGGAGGSFTNNGGTTPTTATYTPAVSTPTTVTLTLTSSGGSCGTTSNNKTLDVNTVPAASVANSNITPQTINVGVNDFTANWSAVSGATGYFLDVATTPTFTLSGSIASDNFENSLSAFTVTSGTASYRTGNSTASDGPSNSPLTNSGTSSLGVNNGSLELTSNVINTSLYSNVQLSFKLASFSLTTAGNGADAGDIVTVEISPDGGTNYYSTLRVLGNSNAYWTYAATGNASTAYDGNATPISFSPSGGGSRTSDGFSSIAITNLPISSNLRVRITVLNNAANELWVLDNFVISGTGSSYVSGYENLAVAGTTQLVSALTAETTYYYRVRAANACGSSAQSNVVSLATSCPAPTSNASAFQSSTSSDTVLNLSWTSGNGNRRIVVAKLGSEPTGVPTNSTTYAANANFTLAQILGDGVVVYNGTGNSATVTNLTPGNYYYFKIFEYNCNNGTQQYFSTVPAQSNAPTRPANVVLAENCTDNSTYQLSWTFGSGYSDGVIIFARASATSSGPGISNANDYTANSNFSFAADLGAKGRVVYKGIGNAVTVTGLAAGVNYTFSAYTYINNTGTVWSNGTSISETINLPNVTNASASADNTVIDIGWSNPLVGCYDEILVIANAGSVVFTPSGDGSAYIANPVYTGANQVIYKGTNVGESITGLTNGTNYCFRIFTRKGIQWSTGVEVCAIPSTITNFEPGDLAIIAINTAVLAVGSTDEVCFVSFKDITENTSFFMTDNGFERINENTWGDTEGVVRLTRKLGAPIVPAGAVICVDGPFTSDPRYDILICGVDDNANWQIESNVIGAGSTSFDLNSSDQIWISQGGSWSNPFGAQNATYNGNVLYGWTGINWKTNTGGTTPTWTTAGSRLYPGTECFTTNMQSVVNNDKSKYTGPLTPTTRLGWVVRINQPLNWTGYSSNANYDNAGAAYDYVFGCISFSLIAPTEVEGKWLGAVNDDWFNCNNWETRVVPDSTVNVIIDNVTGANNLCNVDYNATNAYLFDNVAKCNNIEIRNKSLRLAGNTLDRLDIKGNLIINGAGVLNMNDGTSATDGTVRLFGNWTNINESNFNEGDGLVEFRGTSQQTIQNSGANEVFNNLRIINENVDGILLAKPIEVRTKLTLQSGIVNASTNNVSVYVTNSSLGSIERPGTGHIHGDLSRAIALGNLNYSFPVGGLNTYSPADLNFNGITTTGVITVASVNGDHPNISVGAGFLNPLKSVNRFWAIGNNNVVFNTYTPTFNFQNSDLDIAVNTLAITSGRFDFTNWTPTLVTSPLANSSTLTPQNSFGEFALAECRNPTAYLVSGSITLCEGDLFDVVLSGSENWANYQLFFNGDPVGLPIQGNNVSISFLGLMAANNGTYTIVATNRGSGVCTTNMTGSAIIVVQPLATPSVMISSANGTLGCLGDPIEFTSALQNGGPSPIYSWTKNGLPVGSNSPTFLDEQPINNQLIICQVFSDANCVTQSVVSDTLIITLVNGPEIFAPQSLSYCGLSPFAITGVNAEYVNSISWTENGNGSITSNNFTITPVYTPALSDINTTVNFTINVIGNVPCPNESSSISVLITQGIVYFQDLDGDGFGGINSPITACFPPTGYSQVGGDCCDTNPTINPLTEWWADLDGDGFGSFVYQSGCIGLCDIPAELIPYSPSQNGNAPYSADCNDNNVNSFPGAAEICQNGIDENCNGLQDDNCFAIANDQRTAAQFVSNNPYPQCVQISGTCLNATISPEANPLNTMASGGRDVWYRFYSPSTAVRIVLTPNNFDGIIELQNAAGAELNAENLQGNGGVEILNFGQLTPGHYYWVAIRNYNNTAGGTFSICIAPLMNSTCTGNETNKDLCSNYKAGWTGATSYTYDFKGLVNAPGITTSQSSSTQMPMASIALGLRYGATYQAKIKANYVLSNSIGSLETIVVNAFDSCVFNINPHTQVKVKDNQKCPATLLRNTFLQGKPFVCGTINFTVSFRRVNNCLGSVYIDPAAFEVTTAGPSSVLNLGFSFPQALINQNFYEVKWRPNFTYGSGTFGPSSIIFIGGAALNSSNEIESAIAIKSLEKEIEAVLYPNPNNGDMVVLNIIGIKGDNAGVRIFDGLGRVVYTNRFFAKESLNTILSFSKPLAGGLYTIELTIDGEVLMERMIIEK